MSFNDKVVLVTGASSGIGAAIAILFAKEAANVAIVGRNEDKLKKVSDECEKNGNKPLIIVADMTNEDDVKRIVITTIETFKKIDVLVNNAGIGAYTNILKDDVMESFDKTIATNLRSVVYITHLVARHLIKTKGNVINISSVSALVPYNVENFPYCVSKAGLDHFTRCMAVELASKGIRVNNINPGPVKTSIIENMGTSEEIETFLWESLKKSTCLGRLGEPEEIAELTLFLASDKARSITGASFISDNGIVLKGPLGNISIK